MKGFFQVILPLALLATWGRLPTATLPANGRASLSTAPLSPSGHRMAIFNQLDLYANIETVGVVVRGDDLPDAAELIYRRSSDAVWHSGHPLVRIDDGSLAGSLFGLSPGTSYSVRVLDGASEISGSITTQPDELPFTPLSTVHVDGDAPAGGDGSALAPFQTIQEGVDHADAGTRVLVADGVYHETVTFPTSGSEGHWIQIMAEGDGAILDGAEHLAHDIWTPHASQPGVWFTDIGEPTWYLARDEERFYRYDSRDKLLDGLGHNDVPMSEGWYVDPAGSTLSFVNAAVHCPPLPPPTEPIVTISTEAQLRDQAYNAGPGTTILVESGVYDMQDFVHVVHDGIAIRGATGQRGDVILDMGGMATGHFGILIEADDVTVADLTIREARDHGVSIQGSDRPTLYNLHILDIGDQLVKVNPAGDGSEDGLLACSRLEYTTTAPDEYTNGISAHNAHRWVVRDNGWFRIRTPGNTPAPTILFWSGSTDTVVERNLLVDCFQGISFGNSDHGSGDHFGGIVRNNMIYASLPHDVVIEMVHAEGWLVAHNTAFLRNPVSDPLDWGMEARFPDSQGVFAYNLTNLKIRPDRDGAQATLTGNLTNAEASWFVGAETGDLHLAGSATLAIDQAGPLDEVTDDFDGDPRPFGPAPDVGADEYRAVAPAAQAWLPCMLRGSQPKDLEVGVGQAAP